jgi:hypothetical protein
MLIRRESEAASFVGCPCTTPGRPSRASRDANWTESFGSQERSVLATVGSPSRSYPWARQYAQRTASVFIQPPPGPFHSEARELANLTEARLNPSKRRWICAGSLEPQHLWLSLLPPRRQPPTTIPTVCKVGTGAIPAIVNSLTSGNAKPQLLGLFRIVVRTPVLHMDGSRVLQMNGSRNVGVHIRGGKPRR